MKWAFALLVVLNVMLYLWAIGHRSAGPSIRPQINAEGMRLLGELTPSANRGQSVSCYRIGPFAAKPLSVKAAQRLNALAVPYTELTVKKREVRAYRAYLGPFTQAQQIAQQREILRHNGVSDHYVKREAQGGEVISLGLFSQRRTADDFVRNLAAKNILAKTRSENRTLGPSFWLELRDVDANRDAIEVLRETRWDSERARLRAFPCS